MGFNSRTAATGRLHESASMQSELRRRRVRGELSPVDRAAAASVQSLESRLMLTVNSWINASGGDWDTAANWSLGHVPTASESASITLSGTYTVTHSQSTTDYVNSIASSEPLSLSSGSLVVGSTVQLNGKSLTLAGGYLDGATVTATSGAEVIGNSGGLSGDTINGNLDMSQANGAGLAVYGGLVLNGSLLIGNASGSNYGRIYFGDSVNPADSITGTGTILFGSSSNNYLVNYSNEPGSAGTLTIGPNIQLAGQSGTIYNYNGNGTISNQGIINANLSGGNLYFGNGTGTLLSSGTLEATTSGTLTLGSAWSATGALGENNATLNLGGNFTTLSLVNFFRTGGAVNLTGTLNNTGSTLTLNNITGTWNLAGGQILNGTVNSTAVNPWTTGEFSGGLATNSTSLNDSAEYAALPTNLTTGLTVETVEVWFKTTSSGVIYGEDSSSPGSTAGASQPSAYAPVLMVGTDGKLHAGWYIGSPPTQVISASQVTDGQWHQVALVAGSSVETVYLDGSAIGTLAGVITHQGAYSQFGTGETNGWTAGNGGWMPFNGVIDEANIWNVARTAAQVATDFTAPAVGTQAGLLASYSFDETSGLIAHDRTPNAYNATVAVAPRLVSTSGGTLNGVTLNANVLAVNNTSVQVYNGLVLNGTIFLGDANGATYGRVYFGDSSNAACSLTGTGSVLFGANGNDAVYDGSNFTGAAGTLTIGPSIVIHGQSGAVYNNYANGDIVNQGTINADGNGGGITAGSTTGIFSNTGTLETTNGGTLYLAGPWTNSGALGEINSTLNLGGTFTTASLVNFFQTGGAVNLTGVLTGGLNLNASTGSWNLVGGALINGVLNESSGSVLVFTSSGGSLTGVTANGNIDLSQVNNASLTIYNSLVLNGNLLLGNASGTNYGRIYFGDSTNPAGSLTGTGSVVFGSSSNNGLYDSSNLTGSVGTLTIGTNILIHGQGGTIYNSYGNGSIADLGTINADTAGGALNFGNGNGTFISSGTLEATNGDTLNLGGNWSATGSFSESNSTLNLGGTFATSSVSNLARVGGTINLTGTLTGGLTLNASAGTWLLVGGALVGGTLTESGGGALVFTASGGSLTGLTVNGSLDLSQVSNANVTVYNSMVLNGQILLGNAGGSTYGRIYFGDSSNAAGSLTGMGSVIFGASTNNAFYDQSNLVGAPGTLTIGGTITLHGVGGAINDYNPNGNIISLGTIEADTAGGTLTVGNGNGTFTSSGTLAALNGGTLSLSGSWSSSGAIGETNSTLNLGGSFSTASVGNLTRTAGSVNLTGTVAGGLTLNAGTGSVTLAGGALVNGALNESGGSTLIVSTGSFNGITVNGTLDLSEVNGASLTVYNGLVLNGSLLLGNTGGSFYGRIYFGDSTDPAGNLSGTGTVYFGASSNNDLYDQSNFTGANGTLTIGSGITIHGVNGAVANYYGNGTIVNQGVINADTAGGTLSVGGGSIVDQGAIEATNGGKLNFTSSFSIANPGTIVSTAASTIAVSGSVLGSTQNSAAFSPVGTFNFDGSGTAGSPQFLQVYSQDLGSASSSYSNNFAYGTISLSNSTYVQLTDPTATQAGPNHVLYVNNLIVPAGTTLNLGGLKVYAANQLVNGQISNGTLVGSTTTTNSWNNSSGGNWDTASNWTLGHVPTASENVLITLPGSYTVTHSNSTTDYVNSIISNESVTLSGGAIVVGTTAQFSGGSLTLAGGYLDGGVFNASGGAEVVGNSGGLDGVTLNSNLDLSQVNNANLEIYNGLVLNGALLLGSTSGSTYGRIYFGDSSNPSGSLTGSGSVVFGGTTNDYLSNNSNDPGPAGTLTIGPNISIHGSSGYLYNAYASGTIINSGTINANISGGTLYFGDGTGTLMNTGTLQVSSGDTLNTRSSWSSTGSINETNATLDLGGTFSGASVAGLTKVGGSVNIVGNLVGNFTLNANTGSWTLAGGTLTNGIMNASGGSSLVISSGTLNGETIDGTLDMSQINGAGLNVYNNLVLNGDLLIGNSAGNYYARIYFGDSVDPAGSLSGAGTVLFGPNSNDYLVNYSNDMGSAGTLTIGSGIYIHGQSGTIYNYYGNGTIINQGVVNADTAGGTINFGNGNGIMSSSGTLQATNGDTLNISGAWSSTGALNENNSTLNLGGSFTAGSLSQFSRTGGTVNLTGTLTGGITLNASTGSWVLSGGTLAGGALNESAGATLVFTNTGGNLSGVTVNGTIDLSQVNGATVTVYNSLVLNGPLLLGNTSGSNYGRIYFGDSSNPAGSLTGTGSVLFGASGNDYLVNDSNDTGAAGTLTIGAGILIHGESGYVYNYYTNGSIVVQGTLNADTPGGTLSLGNGNGIVSSTGTLEATNGATLTLNGSWSSSGTISETNSTLNLAGSFMASSINAFARSAGTVNLTGTVTGGLNLNASTGSWIFSGALVNGTLNESGGAVLVFSSSGGSLSGVTVNGNVDLSQINSASVTVYNSMILNGNLLLGNASGSNYGRIYFGDSTNRAGSLSGNATVTFGASTNNGLYDQSNLAGSGGTLILAPTVTIHGVDGTIFNSYGNGTIANQGTINADGGTLTFGNSAGTLTNSGTLEATGGATLNVAGSWSNTGSLSEINSTLNLGGVFSVPSLANSFRNGGSINVTGTLIGGLSLNATTGSWTLAGGSLTNGTLNESGGSVLVISSGSFNGVTVNGNLDLSDVNGASLTVYNSLVLNGSLLLGNASGSNYGRIYFGDSANPAGSLTGTGSVVFGVSTNNAVYDQSNFTGLNGTLTIGSGITIHGVNGSITNSYGNGSIISSAVINADAAGGGISVGNGNGAFTSNGTLEATNNATLSISGVWSNFGTLTENNATLNLGGSFTQASLGTFTRTAGTINLTGTLTGGLSLTAATGSWYLAGGTISNGTLTQTGGSALYFTSSGTLSGVTLGSNVTVNNGASVNIANGLTLNNVSLTLASTGSSTYLYFRGTQTLGGTGQLVFAGISSNNVVYTEGGNSAATASMLTIGANITVSGSQGGTITNYYGPDGLINNGTINADTSGQSIVLGSGPAMINLGTLTATAGGILNIYPALAMNGQGLLQSDSISTVILHGSLSGNTSSVALINPQGQTNFAGSGTAAAPQTIEAMSSDLGNVPAGYSNNAVYGQLVLSNSTYAELVDQSDNSAGSGSEAVYAQSIIISAGSTLNLNGLHLYAHSVQISGNVSGGTINQIPNSGAVTLGTTTPGDIATAGQLDEWSFFDYGGRTVSILINPGTGGSPAPVSPQLQWASVKLTNGSTVLATNADTGAGGIITLSNIVLPADGTYDIFVNAPPGHTASTGNYLLSVYDVTPNVQTLTLNQTADGTLGSPFALDNWNFSAQAGQQIQFNLNGTTNPNIAFTLTGPGGYTAFQSASASSNLIDLPASGTYTLSVDGINGATGSYSFSINQTTVTNLPLSTTYNGTWSGSGQAELFSIPVTTTNPLSVVLTDPTVTDSTELYASFGVPPTRETYDYGMSSAGSSHSLLIPEANAGMWYVLAYSASIAAPPTNYTLRATSSEVVLTATNTAQTTVDINNTITLSGAGFIGGTKVSLIAAGGAVYPATSSSTDLPTQITATFAANSTPAGTYSIEVTQPDGTTSILPNSLTLASSGQGILTTRIEIPNPIGRHIASVLYVDYSNTGNAPMPAPLLVLSATNPNGPGALMTLNPNLQTSGFWTSATPTGYSQSVDILASGATPGVLQPGEAERVPVYYAGWIESLWDFSNSEVTFTLDATQSNDKTPVDWASMESSAKPSTIPAAAWNVMYSNLTYQLGNTAGGYVQLLDNEAAYLGSLGENVTDISSLWNFAVSQTENLWPQPTLASTEDISLATPGTLSLSFDRSFNQSIVGRFEGGPLGAGWSTPWQQSLSVAGDGSVIISDGSGGQQEFQPDSRYAGQYFSQPGDYSKLTAVSGGFDLTAVNGIVTFFNSNGSLGYMQDDSGNTISAIYSNGQLSKLQASSGQSLSLGYNSAGLISSLTDSSGRVVRYRYDADNQYLLSVTGFDGATTSYTYDTNTGDPAQNALTSVTYPGGTHEYFNYDNQGRLSATYGDEEAQPSSFTYSSGQVTIADGTGDKSNLYYNENGEIARAVDALGNPTFYVYDSNHDLVRVTNATGSSASYAYNSVGEVTSFTDYLGGVTRFTYSGPENEISSLTDADGNTTRYSYDSSGDATSVTYANGTSENVTYDPLGEAKSFVNANGQPVTYSYNSAGQIASEGFSDGTTYTYTYDAYGHLLTATDAGGTTNFTYSPVTALLTKVSYSNGTSLTFAYNSAGLRTQMVDQTGFTVNYQYDIDGRLSELSDKNGALIVSYQYDANGRISKTTNGNGTYSTNQYNPDGQIEQLTNYGASGQISTSFSYAYNGLGQEIGETTAVGDWTYTYNADNELIHGLFTSTSSGVPNQDISYTYDAMGNRLSSTINGVSTAYAVNDMNQYTQVGGESYSYDADGNLLSDGVDSYTYNILNELTGLTTPTSSITYTYGALGVLLSSSTSGSLTNYLVDPSGWNLQMGSFSSNGTAISELAYGNGLASESTSSGNYYYQFDGIGNAVSLSDRSGTQVDQYNYLPFGGQFASSATVTNPFEFDGLYGETTSSGFVTMSERLYSINDGRFTSEDPAASTTNLYLFAGNNPAEVIDPSGECWIFGPFQNGGPSNFVGFSLGASLGFSAGASIGGGIGADASVGPGFVFPGINGGLASAGVGVHAGAGVGVSYGLNAGASLGYSHGSSWGFGFGWGWGDGCPQDPPKDPMPPSNPPPGGPNPNPPGGGGSSGGSSSTVNSQDPNALYGPAGYGSLNYIQGNTNTSIFPYRIDFENSATAGAPAQEVTISESLDLNLNWSTFQLTGVGFGDYNLTIPADSQYYQTTVSITYNGQTFDVDIDAGINEATGQVYATFQSINPATDLPPSNVLVGFLPPEDGTGRGMGYLSYTVSPKMNLPTGTAIRSVAEISFDDGQPLATDLINDENPGQGIDPTKQALVTVDSGSPASTVAALPPTESSASFVVNWSGQDDSGGSGIATYTIYVSTNGGAYTTWLANTNATSGTFTGQKGSTYSFYSVATDNVGNVQPTPAAAQATTTVTGSLQPLVLSGPALYLERDPDGLHLDIWNSTSNAGSPSQSDLLSGISAITVSGAAGGTNLTVDFSNGDPLTSSGITFNGSAGGVNLLNVIGTAGNDTFNVSGTSLFESANFGFATLNYSNVSTITFSGGTGSDVLNQLAQPGGGATVTFAGTTSSDTLNVDAGSYTFAASGAGSRVVPVTLGALNISAGARAIVAASNGHPNRTVLILNTLNIAGSNGMWTGTLDLNDNDMVIHNGSLSTVTSQILSGYNTAGGLWKGLGLTTSTGANDSTHLTALGELLNNNGLGNALYGAGSVLGLFDNVNPAVTDILVKYTYFGDANLDGIVDGSDYSRIDNGVLNHASGWANGDFNYDGTIDGTDYTLIDNTSNTQGLRLSLLTPVFTLPTAPTLTYDGTSDVTSWVTASLTGVAGQPAPTGSVVYQYFSGTAATGTPLAAPPQFPGTYTVIASYSGNAIYAPELSNPITFTINKAAATVTLAAGPATIKYDGTTDVTNWVKGFAVGVTGAALATGAVTPVYYSGPTATGTPLASSPTAVGTYTVVGSYSGDSNYAASLSAPLTFTISAATGSMPLTLTGSAFYLKLDANGLNLDIWNSTGDIGTPGQSVALSTISSIAVNGVAGGTTLSVDYSAGEPLVPSGLNFIGIPGAANILKVIDTGDSGAASFVVDATNVHVTVTSGTEPLTYSNVSAINVYAGSGADSLTQNVQPGGGATLAYLNTTASDNLTINGGTFTFAAAGAGSGITSVVLGNVAVAAGAKLIVAPPDAPSDRRVMILNNLFISGSTNAWQGQVDLTSNDLIIHGGNAAQISNEIQAGFNGGGGYWNGQGITSSAAATNNSHLTALGAELNNNGNGQLLFGSGTVLGLFDGQNPTLTDVLIKYTYYGDANLDGKVDGSDYSKIDNGYLNHLTGWLNGDFNYDGSVNGSDYTLVDNAFNMQGASLAVEVSPKMTPAADEIAPTDHPPTPHAKPRAEKASAMRSGTSSSNAASFAPNIFRSGTPISFSEPLTESIALSMEKKDLLDGLAMSR